MASRGVLPISRGCGGVEVATYYLARSLAQLGHHVTLVGDVDTREFPTSEGLSLVSVERRIQRLVRGLPGSFSRWVLQHLVGNVLVAAKVREVVRTHPRYDVIHVHGSLCALLVSRFADAPVVYTEHDATPYSCRYRRWYERAVRKVIYRAVNVSAFRRVDRVVTVFQGLADEICVRWKIPPGKLVSIRNGANVDILNPHTPRVSEIKDTYGFDRYCLFVGSLVSRKCPDLLLEAIAEAGHPCVFVGDGPMMRRLQRRACQLNLQERVAFLGSLPPEELGPVYAGADMLVLPSASEGSPLVVIEAMAYGIPVVATKVAGIPSMVCDWETGFLVKPGDVGQLVMAIRFLAGDADLRARMGDNARRTVFQQYPWTVIAGEYAELYEETPRLGLSLGDGRVLKAR